MCFLLFFKQKTAYEMRISDWSSDVCSSDLQLADRDRRNRRKIGSLRSPDIGNIGELDRRAAMAPFAVHEHQRLVRRQAAQRERPGENGAVVADDALDVERRDLGAEKIVHVGRRSEEHTSELQSLMRTSYAVFCLK